MALEGFLRTLKIGSRPLLVTALSVGAAIGCATNVTVVDNPIPTTNPTATPVFNGAANQAASAPLPISGGTVITIVKQDGSAIAVVADPEEDVIDVVSLGTTPALLGTLELQPGDEPGRMVADAAGRVHVVLRSGGGIATIIPTSSGASLVGRRSVCAAPRGVDYDAASDSLYVACATGEMAVLPAAGGSATLSTDLLDASGAVERDLRDVVVDANNVYVTKFRSADIIKLDKALNRVATTLPPVPSTLQNVGNPEVAWRTVRQNNGGLQIVYQIASTNPIDVATPPGVSSYGGDPQQINNSGGVVTVAAGSFNGTSMTNVIALQSNPVVDIANMPNGGFETVSINGVVEVTGQAPLQIVTQNDVSTTSTPDEYVAIADARSATNPVVVVQRRGMGPALLVLAANGPSVDGNPIIVPLPQKLSHVDTGFDIFHVPTPAGIACMNCHPEGGDDGHVWKFQMTNETRARRTQSLHGGSVTNSAPYHWDGDMADMQMLCDEVFTHRMGGGSTATAQTPVLAHYLANLPRVPVKANLNQTRIAKGQTIFFGNGGCTGCHTGGTGTLSTNMDIGKVDSFFGTSVPLQVPMLLYVADRAPYMHDGCAASLKDRFTVGDCAGTKHGNTASLSSDDVTNLVEYLQTL